MKFSTTLFILINAFLHSHQTPQIFEEVKTCELVIKDPVNNKKSYKFTVPSYINVNDSEHNVLFSLCDKIPLIFPNNNGSCRNTCVYRRDSKTVVSSAHSTIVPYEVVDKSVDELVLQLQEVLKCTEKENYTIKVKMIQDSKLRKPTLNTISQCELEIEMLMPGYEPPCTYLIDKKDLIDLRPLKGKSISIVSENSQFNLALCGPNRQCGFDGAGCMKMKGNDATLIFGLVKFQRVVYDTKEKQLKVKASFKKEGEKSKLEMEVVVKCDWKTPFFSNPKYIKPANQGKSYKFEVYSSFGCIKSFTNCVIKSGELTYDLRSLFKKDGYKVTLGSSFYRLNVCGHLVSKGPKENGCDTQYSQVCQVKGSLYTNKGSIPTYEVTENHIEATFSEGDKCNQNQTYSTKILIKCSNEEKGPIFLSEENCVTKFSFETPKACPKFEKEANSCSLSTSLGSVNLSHIYRKEDRTHSFLPSGKFEFNICGNIHSNCSSYKNNVVACYSNGKSQQIIGWNSPELTFKNGKLQLKYFGEDCNSSNKKSSLTINFFCSYEENPEETVLRKTDSCTFIANIHSSFACFSSESENCVYEDGSFVYDLTNLVRKSKNLEIKDENYSNISYFLNVCRPLINQDGLLFSGTSMVYRRDKSKPHISERFTSIGKLAGPTVQNGKLLINSIMGESCELGVDFQSKIFFECGKKDETPKLLRKKNNCIYEFIWKTRNACPKPKPGGRCSMNEDSSKVNLPSDEITLSLNHTNVSYFFSLCLDEYKKCENNVCSDKKLSRKIRKENGKNIVQLNLNETAQCSDNFPLKMVDITVQCDLNQKDITLTRMGEENCAISLFVKSKMACDIANEIATEGNTEISNKHIPGGLFLGTDKSSNSNRKKQDTVRDIELHDETRNDKEKDNDHIETKYEIVENKDENNIQNETSPEEVNVVEQKVEIKTTKEHDNVFVKSKDETVEKEEDENLHKTVVDEVKVEQSQNTTVPKQTIHEDLYQRCNIGKGKKFQLRNIKSTEINKKNRYSINFDGSLTNCPGSICRNGNVILSFIENCPDVTYNDTYVQLQYTVNGGCHSSGKLSPSSSSFSIKLLLRCNRTGEIFSVLEEDACKASFQYQSREACDLFTDDKSSSSSFLGISLVILLFVLLGICFAFWVYRMKYFRKCSYDPVGGSEMNLIEHPKMC